MSRTHSLLSFLVIGAAVSQAATITAGSASSTALTGLILASQMFSLSGPGFTFTGSGTSDNQGPCALSCRPGDILRFSAIGNGPDGGMSGTLTVNGVSQNYSFGGGFPTGLVEVNFDLDLVVPPIPASCLPGGILIPACSVVLTGPFTADAQMLSLSPSPPFSTVLFDALGGGAATITLATISPNNYFFLSQSFNFVPVPEPAAAALLTLPLAAASARWLRRRHCRLRAYKAIPDSASGPSAPPLLGITGLHPGEEPIAGQPPR